MILAGHSDGLIQTIARHVMQLHMNRETDNEVVGEIEIDKMKRYISYVKR